MIIAHKVVERMVEPKAVVRASRKQCCWSHRNSTVTTCTRPCKPKPEQVPAWRGVRQEVPPQARSYGEFLAAGSGGRDTDIFPTNIAPDKSASHIPTEHCILKKFWTN